MKFTVVRRKWWQAWDKADSYEIFHENKVGYACFKNRVIWIATKPSLHDAIAACEREQVTQEWFSQNPENAAKNAVHRAERDKNRKASPRDREVPRPVIWREDISPCTK